MQFDALEYSLKVIRLLRSAIRRIQRLDLDLARQLRRSLSSISLNLSEGQRRIGKDRTHLWRIAAGSAAESHTALRIALAWGYIREDEVQDALQLLDRVLGMLYSMTH